MWKSELKFVVISWPCEYLFWRYLDDLNEGVYIQQTLETVLLNEDGKQLLVMKTAPQTNNLLCWYDGEWSIMYYVSGSSYSARPCICMGWCFWSSIRRLREKSERGCWCRITDTGESDQFSDSPFYTLGDTTDRCECSPCKYDCQCYQW